MCAMKIGDNSMRRLDGVFDAVSSAVDRLRANGRPVCGASIADIHLSFGHSDEDRTEEVLVLAGVTVRLTGETSWQ